MKMRLLLLETNIDTWGDTIQRLVLSIIVPIAVAILAWNILPLIFKRDWIKIFTTIVLGGLAVYVVNNPEFAQDIGKDIIEFLKGGGNTL
jgi:hypothetical protein